MGSSNYITNFDGEVSQHMEYFAFGETFVEEHKNSNNSPYKFNGKELDDESGLYYYGARYYDPRISIWASVDPVILNEEFFASENEDLSVTSFNSFNLSCYTYCYQSPVKLNDSDGENPVLGAILGAAVDYGIQVAANYAEGKSGMDAFTNNINVSSIALSAIEGGLTSGGSVLRKIAVKGAVMAANNIVEIKRNDSGNWEGNIEKNPRNILKNVIVDATVDGATKGAGKFAKKALSKAGFNSGSIAKTVKSIMKASNLNVTRKANDNIKKVSKQVVKQTEKTLENFVKYKTNKPVSEKKTNSNER